MNAGSTTSDAAVYTGVGDSDGTSAFTPSDGSTPASSVNVGDWASVFVTAGATVAVFVGRVTAVAAGVNGAITVSTTAKSGTFPAASAGAHTITCKTGGAWRGPNAAVSFPLGFITSALTDAAGDSPRVNLLAGTSYAVTAAMTHALAGPVRFQGYASAPGDGGRAVIDGGSSGVSYVVLALSGNDVAFQDVVFQNNGASAAASVVNATGQRARFERCVFSGSRLYGLIANSSSGTDLVECEFFGNNQSNTANGAGLQVLNALQCERCYFHDNAGTNTYGVYQTGGSANTYRGCVFESNGAHGAFFNISSAVAWAHGCDFYGNGVAASGSGIKVTGTTSLLDLENCNFVKNTAYGVDLSAVTTRHGRVVSCAFGAGTQANGLGQINSPGSVEVLGSITLPSGLTPWNAPSTGDFSVTLPQCKGSGRGNFTQTGGGKSGTLGRPDVGAAQHQDAGGVAGLPLGRAVGGL